MHDRTSSDDDDDDDDDEEDADDDDDAQDTGRHGEGGQMRKRVGQHERQQGKAGRVFPGSRNLRCGGFGVGEESLTIMGLTMGGCFTP